MQKPNPWAGVGKILFGAFLLLILFVCLYGYYVQDRECRKDHGVLVQSAFGYVCIDERHVR